MLLVVLSARAPRPTPDPLLKAPALQITWGQLEVHPPPPPGPSFLACLALISNMSLPPIPTWSRQPSGDVPVDTVSNLIRHGRHTYAVFWARVNADRPARDNRWDHFVNLCLR